jgi:periplasmic divalent cation tolerance protein
MDVVLVLTTVPDVPTAETIARALVEERLAACVNALAPMTSVYRWNGAVTRDEERQLIVKTTRDRVGEVEARLAALHPYELPELLVVTVDGGSERYLAWVRAETGPPR